MRKPKDIDTFQPAAKSAEWLRWVADNIEKNDSHPDISVSLKLKIRRWDNRWEKIK